MSIVEELRTMTLGLSIDPLRDNVLVDIPSTRVDQPGYHHTRVVQLAEQQFYDDSSSMTVEFDSQDDERYHFDNKEYIQQLPTVHEIKLQYLQQSNIKHIAAINEAFNNRTHVCVNEYAATKTKYENVLAVFNDLQTKSNANLSSDETDLVRDGINKTVKNFADLLAGLTSDHTAALETIQCDRKLALATADREYKASERALYEDTAINNLLDKILHPSREMELGMAVAILLHKNPKFCPDVSKSSSGLITQFLKHHMPALAEKNSEEELISLAKTVLLESLSRDYIPLGNKKYEYTFIPKSDAIKLTDTCILHSFNVERTEKTS